MEGSRKEKKSSSANSNAHSDICSYVDDFTTYLPLSFSLFPSLTLSLSFLPSFLLSLFHSVSNSLSLSFTLSPSLSVCVCVYVSPSVHIYLSLSLSLSLTLHYILSLTPPTKKTSCLLSYWDRSLGSESTWYASPIR